VLLWMTRQVFAVIFSLFSTTPLHANSFGWRRGELDEKMLDLRALSAFRQLPALAERVCHSYRSASIGSRITLQIERNAARLSVLKIALAQKALLLTAEGYDQNEDDAGCPALPRFSHVSPQFPVS
jgi:hypothetical protein